MRRLSLLLILLILPVLPARAQSPIDSDHDGLNDDLEQSLLLQFAPDFQVARHDCSTLPAEFQPLKNPTVHAENGTIYGQVSPARSSTPAHPLIEIHFYHLWRTDCGPHGHALDTEHVATLIAPAGPTHYRALYWYAAAHEDTVCDVSQIARASTLKAEDHGARVWISPGKHASYLNETLCRQGCGADRCERMSALRTAALINLGEPAHPMNGAIFIAAPQWPLAAKMAATNFPAAPLARLEALPETDIAWFVPGRHPAQQIISTSLTTRDAIGGSLATSGQNTDSAISLAGDATGNALSKSYRNTVHALGTSARHVGDALHVTPEPTQPNPRE